MPRYHGLAASDGIAIGPAWVYRPAQIAVDRHLVPDPAAEWERLQAALALARRQLQVLEERAAASVGADEAAIFEAHQLFVEDEELLGAVKGMILDERLNAGAAVYDAFEHYAQVLAAAQDQYFQARAQDVRDVRARVLRCLHGASADGEQQLTRPAIVVAEDLTPSDTLQFERSNILAFCTVRGGPTSHAVILARGLGIPAVVSTPLELSQIDNDTPTILDGRTGDVIFAPTPADIEQAKQSQSAWQAARGTQLAAAHQPAVTLDGHRVEVVANIGNLDDARRAIEQGAEGVGLFRTEFLYLDRSAMPAEEEQRAAYRSVFQALGSRPVVVRTLDIGGDKAVSYLGVVAEPNPFLGWRAIRMIRERPDVLANQLHALLAAGGETGADLRIMLPMVSSLDEIERAREILREAEAGVKAAGHPLPKQLQFGIMVEVPSAAVIADVLAAHVDFFSIGTNDLTQYTLAVDRTNERVAALASPYHPALLRLIQTTIQGAHAHGKWVGLCGEFAGDVLAVPVLLGLGLDEFSMAAGSIPAVKDAIRHWTLAECQAVAAEALRLPTAARVIEFLKSRTPR